jgi:hypothetical protein
MTSSPSPLVGCFSNEAFRVLVVSPGRRAWRPATLCFSFSCAAPPLSMTPGNQSRGQEPVRDLKYRVRSPGFLERPQSRRPGYEKPGLRPYKADLTCPLCVGHDRSHIRPFSFTSSNRPSNGTLQATTRVASARNARVIYNASRMGGRRSLLRAPVAWAGA